MEPKPLIFLVAVFALVVFVASEYLSGSVAVSSLNINWKTFDEGIHLAQRENKKILVDVYTDWCSWCRKMDREVYSDTMIVRIIETTFIAIKLNAESSNRLNYRGESMTEQEFSRAIGVTGFPTTIFLNPDSSPITLVPGYVERKMFSHVLNFIGNNQHHTRTFDDYLRQQDTSE
jgi:thioredoxin-related protein